MRIPNKPGENLHQNLRGNREGLLNAFSKEIVHGNVVLLLGHESLLRIPTSEEAIQDENLQMLRECCGSMEKWMSLLKAKYYNESSGSVKEFYINMFSEDSCLPRLDADDMNPEIRKLIEAKVFRVILTTTYDPLIEEVMEDTWGGKGCIAVKNFGDRGNKDFTAVDKMVLSDDITPTLYYLFGKATDDVSNYGNPQFIVDEEDYIQTIRDWMVTPPKSLMTYLANKRILAVGCKFDNWLFRFFWRAVLEAKRNTDDFKHLLAVSLTSSPADQKLREIFKLYNLKYPEDVTAFLNGLNKAITLKTNQLLQEERGRGGIFLSYCSQDYARVLNLFYKLKDYGFNVWMDVKELLPGDEYKRSIIDAIDHCAVFVPVLSAAVSSHLPAEDPYNENDANYHFYRDFEWNRAMLKYENDNCSTSPSQNPMSIIPFALGDYNFRSNSVPVSIRESYPLIFEKTLDTYDNAGFVRFVQILKKLIR